MSAQGTDEIALSCGMTVLPEPVRFLAVYKVPPDWD